MGRKKLFSIILLAVLVLSACQKEQQPNNAIDDAVMPAWIGDFSIENRKNAISTYQKKYIPVYAINVKGDTVRFQIDFEGVSCGNVILTPVDDATKDGELNTIVDFAGEATVDGNEVTVDIGWWFDASQTVKSSKQWSYLLWVKDAEGMNHYYYFRVVYTS